MVTTSRLLHVRALETMGDELGRERIVFSETETTVVGNRSDMVDGGEQSCGEVYIVLERLVIRSCCTLVYFTHCPEGL
jgi:hypothetical protein